MKSNFLFSHFPSSNCSTNFVPIVSSIQILIATKLISNFANFCGIFGIFPFAQMHPCKLTMLVLGKKLSGIVDEVECYDDDVWEISNSPSLLQKF